MTFREFCLRAMAYERLSVQPWQIARFLALKTIEPHLAKNAKVTVFDILPLPGDPSKEELQEMGKKRNQSAIAIYELKKEKYKALGYINDLPNAKASTPTP